MDEQTRRRFERWQLESLAGGETAKAGLFGKTLGLLGLDADGNRAATSWTDAAKHTAGNLINAPQDIGNQLLDLKDYQPVYGTGASNPEDRARAGQQAVSTFGLAGLAPLGGMAVGKMAGVSPIENNAAGVFGGRLARTADHQKLATAEEMAAKGVPREQIWNETGWFTGADGKWRFEIDDSGAKLRRRGDTFGDQWKRTADKMDDYPSVADMLRHPNLADAYPHVARSDVKLVPHSSDHAGQYLGGEYKLNRDLDRGESLDTFLHEIQHGVQKAEGFADTPKYQTLNDDQYRRASPEVEARAVEARRALSADQRAARPPWLDYDVPENQQIVRFNANSKEGALPGLAMDHASRMQRARELGYDPDTTLYHGTNKEFDSFDTGKAGSGVGTSGESATWLTPSPAEASAWAKVTGGGNGDRVLPVHTRMTNPKIISSSELTQLRIPSKPDTLAYNSKVFEAELEKARAAGHDGVVFKNVDEGFAHGAQDQIAVFDPSNIRSKFAAFDPTQSHSPDLLASNAREGAVPGLGMTAQSEQNDPYRTALQMQARRKLLGLPY